MMNDETEYYLQTQAIEVPELPRLEAEAIKQRYIRRTRRQRLTRALGCVAGLLAAASSWWLGGRPVHPNITAVSPANTNVESSQAVAAQYIASQWQEQFTADLNRLNQSADELSEIIHAEKCIKEIQQANTQYVQHIRNRAAYDYWVHQSDLASQ